jgi:hypothetical protein
MKITIEPTGTPGGMSPVPTVSFNTNTDDDNTRDAVEAAFQVIIAAGHHWKNVLDAAEELCGEIRSVTNTATENEE